METPHDPDASPGQRGYLSAGYEKSRPYGKPEGLADRLEAHAEKLAKDKATPWLGLGLYDDLRVAVAVLRGQPVPKKAPVVEPEPEPWEKISTEYDL